MHDIGRELETQLRARGCPLRVIDGPEPTQTTTWGRERIVLEYGKSFRFGPPRSQSINPDKPWNLEVPGVITIYAQSPGAGAMYFEHQRRALLVARMVAVALRKVLVTRNNWPTLETGGFIDPPDLAESDSRGGAVFSISFTFQSGVPDLTWVGEAEPKGTLAGMTSVTKARFPNGAIGDAETACGG